MEHIGSTIEKMFQRNRTTAVYCRKCGTGPILRNGKQYTLRCPSCGTHITLSRDYAKMLDRNKIEEDREKGRAVKIEHDCNLCKDKGFVVLEEQLDDALVPLYYRCMCAAGRSSISGWPIITLEKASGLLVTQITPPEEWLNG